MRLVYGVGFNDKTKPSRSNGLITKEYKLWMQMIKRCYSSHIKYYRPSYNNCTVSENFKSYSYFYDWCQGQIGFNLDRYHLDKDILFKNNKIYHEDFCVFVPQEINGLITKSNATRGDLPIGVNISSDGLRIEASVRVDGKRKYLGYFDNKIDAFNAYKSEKEAHIKSVARRYKNIVDDRVYQSLINYEVDIND